MKKQSYINWSYTAGHEWRIFSYLDVNCIVLQGWYIFTYSLECLTHGVILSYMNDEVKIVAIQKSVLYNDGNLVIILSTFVLSRKWQEKKNIKPFFCKRYLQYYEVIVLFLWEMPAKMMISCLLNIVKICNSAQINWSSTLNSYQKYLFGRNNIHREIDRWNRHRFGAKWNVTVPNSVMPVKPLVCKWIYMSQSNVVKWHPNYTCVKFSSAFSWNCDFEQFL